MKPIKLITVAVAVLISATCCRPQCSDGTKGKKGNLTIKPIDRSKNWSEKDSYYVKEFVDLRSNVDRSGLFGRRVKAHIDNYSYYAAHVPFGRYRITLESKSGSISFGRLIDVCQRDQEVEVSRQFARVHIVSLLESLNSVSFDTSNLTRVTKFQNVLDKTEMSSLFQGAVAEQVPYGDYHLEFILALGLIKREVDAFQPDVWVFSDDLAFYGDSDQSGPGNIVRGEVKNIPANEKPVFMTMSGVNAPYMVNSVVSDAGNGNGTFSFVANNPSSVYMLFTVGKSGILDAREFKIPRDSEIVVDLAHPNPPKIDGAP